MIVIPMAGTSRRFLDAGYENAKFMLPLWDGYVFDYAVSSFADQFSDTEILFIYRQTRSQKEFLESRVRALGIKHAHLCALEELTAGQAETVEVGIDRAELAPETPLTIFNIDTFRLPWVRPPGIPGKADGWLEVFRGEGDNWSFVRPADEPGLAAETTEKVPISDLCCTGLYHFATADLFKEALAEERRNPSSPELYIAPIYNHLIERGHRIGYGVIESDAVLFCGVPNEYEELQKRAAPYAIPSLSERSPEEDK